MKKISAMKYAYHVFCLRQHRKKMNEYVLTENTSSFKKCCSKIDDHLTEIIRILFENNQVESANKFSKKKKELSNLVSSL